MTATVVRTATQTLAETWLSGREFVGRDKRPITLKEDPFALSWASYRHWIQGAGRWPSFDILDVKDTDREQGQAMRNYYRGRLTWNQLKVGGELSSFRSRLAALVSGVDHFVESDLGVLYRLPYFWQEDQAHDRIFFGRPLCSQLPEQQHNVDAELTLREAVLVSRRSRERTQFWFDSDATPLPVMLTVTEDNPLKSLLISMIDRAPLTLRANWRPVHMRGYHREHVYYDITMPRLV